MSVLSVVASSAAGLQANSTSVVDPTARVHHRARIQTTEDRETIASAVAEAGYVPD